MCLALMLYTILVEKRSTVCPTSTLCASIIHALRKRSKVCLVKAWMSPIHALRKTIHGWSRSTVCAEHIYLSRGSVCPFQCSRELGNALFSTCAYYNWRLVSNKLILPGILAMMQMTQGRQQQRSETPEKQQLLHDKAATRKSPDQRESGRLERQKEYQRAYRRRRRKAVAATEQTVT